MKITQSSGNDVVAPRGNVGESISARRIRFGNTQKTGSRGVVNIDRAHTNPGRCAAVGSLEDTRNDSSPWLQGSRTLHSDRYGQEERDHLVRPALETIPVNAASL